MKKAKVKKITLAEKIYIAKEDVEDADHLLGLYTYDNGDEFLSTISEDEYHYIVPSNSYHKLEWDEIDDNRNFEQTDADLTFCDVHASRFCSCPGNTAWCYVAR